MQNCVWNSLSCSQWKKHVHCLGSFRLYFTIGDRFRHRIICLQRCCQLLVSHFLQDYTQVSSFTCRDVESSQFGLCGWCHYMFDDVCNVEDGTVIVWYSGISWKENMSSCSAARFWIAKVTGIAMCSQFHVARVVGQDGFLLGGHIIEELLHMCHRIFGRGGWLRRDSANWE